MAKATYQIWRACVGETCYETIAVDANELKGEESKARLARCEFGFSSPGARDAYHIGAICIEGDAHFLPAWYTLEIWQHCVGDRSPARNARLALQA